MVAAFDIPFAEPRTLTQTEYERMAKLGFFAGERVELIHGIVVRMAPIGPRHLEITGRLTELLVIALAGRARVRVQAPLLAGDDSEPEPDVAVVARADYGRRHPDRALLVIEVAHSSLSYDRETKARLYASSGVEEYWVVDVEGQSVEVFREPRAGRFTEVRRCAAGSAALQLRAFPDVEVSVDALFTSDDT